MQLNPTTAAVTLLLLTALIVLPFAEAKKYKTLKNDKRAKDVELKSTQKRSKKDTVDRKIPQTHENTPPEGVYADVEDAKEEVVIRKKVKPHKSARPKSKNFKVLTEYEQCKMECRRKRDLEDAKQLEIELLKEKCRIGAGGISCSNAQLSNYIAHLKEELASAEKALNDALKNEESDEPSKSFIEINVNEKSQPKASPQEKTA